MSAIETQNNLMDTAMESGVKKATENVVNRAVNAIVNFVKDRYGESQVKLGTVFQRYLVNASHRYNQIRTLATGPDPRKIIGEDSIYVEIGVNYKGKRIETTTVDELLNIGNNLIVSGTGGIGKSMLMRYLFLNTAQRGEYVPVLVELRRIGNQPHGKISIFELIYTCMQEFDVELPKSQFEYSLRLGKYLFLFDGFDEVKEIYSAETAEAIQSFCSKYPKNSSIVTSRPRHDNFPFETFTTVKSMTLSKPQAVRLASKIWKENEKTKEFCNQLNATLYEQHKDFAENPLLLSMMFLTFMRNNSIPEHLADFYKKAYEALYSAHDNNDKGYYRRDFKCKELDENKFSLLLSHFCFQSYFKEQYEFSEDEILSYLEKGIHKFGYVNVPADYYLSDLRNIVCIIIKDGEIYRFSHRSFQDYFAARYTSTLTDKEQKRLFFSILSEQDVYWNKKDYYELLSQIEPERFFINALEKQLRRIQKDIDLSSEPEMFLLKLWLDAVRFCSNNGQESFSYFINVSNDDKFYSFNILDIFATYFAKIVPVTSNKNGYEKYWEIIKRYIIKIKFQAEEEEDVVLNESFLNEKNTSNPFSEVVLYFSEIDESDIITKEERKNLYSAIIRNTKIAEVCSAIRNCLSVLDDKKCALRSTNFIDEL